MEIHDRSTPARLPHSNFMFHVSTQPPATPLSSSTRVAAEGEAECKAAFQHTHPPSLSPVLAKYTLKIKMEETSVWYSCSFCKRAFQDKLALLTHKKSVHLEDLKEKRRQLSYGSDDSSSEDEDPGPVIHIGQPSLTQMGLSTHFDDGLIGCQSGLNGSVTFWTESSTTEIVYLSDEEVETMENSLEDADPDEVIIEEFSCENCQMDFQNVTKFKVHTRYCQKLNSVEPQCDSLDPLELLEEEEQIPMILDRDEVSLEIQTCASSPEPQKSEEIPSSPREPFPKIEEQKEQISQTEFTGENEENPKTPKKISNFLRIPKPRKTKSPRKPQGQPKMFNCDSCEKSFSWQKSLTLHQRNVHSKDKDPRPESQEIVVEPDLTQLTDQPMECNSSTPDDQPQSPRRNSDPILTQLINAPLKNVSVLENPFLPREFLSTEKPEVVEVDEFMTVFCQLCYRNFPSGELLAEHLKICQFNQNLAMLVMYMQSQQNPYYYWTPPYLPTTPLLLPPVSIPIASRPPRTPSPPRQPTPPSGLPLTIDLQKSPKTKEEEPYRCDTCDKTFPKRWSLTAHTKTHTRPYGCSICSRSFSKSHNLKMHYIWHGKALDKRTYNCDLCPQSFGDMSSLCRHKKVHSRAKLTNSPVDEPSEGQGVTSGSDKIISPTATYRCRICQRGFLKKSALTQHSRVHSSFKCPFCSLTAEGASQLASHVEQFHASKRQESLCWEEEYLRRNSFNSLV